MATGTYSSKDFDLVIGTTLVKEWESVVIDTNDRWEHDHGNDGRSTRVEQANFRYVTVTLNMKQGALDNTVLSAYFEAGLQIPVGMRDKNGQTTFAAAQMSVERPSSVTHAKSELNDKGWRLKGDYQLWVDGGNS